MRLLRTASSQAMNTSKNDNCSTSEQLVPLTDCSYEDVSPCVQSKRLVSVACCLPSSCQIITISSIVLSMSSPAVPGCCWKVSSLRLAQAEQALPLPQNEQSTPYLRYSLLISPWTIYASPVVHGPELGTLF